MSIFRKTIENLKRVKRTVISFGGIASICCEESYYPEEKRKSYVKRMIDNIIWCLKNQENNKFYNLYGLDIKGSKADLYNPYYSFMVDRNIFNHVSEPTSETVLLRDKLLFYKYMKMHEFPVATVFAVIKDGELMTSDYKKISWDAIRDEKDYFLKDVGGECASFVKHILDYNDLLQYQDQYKKGVYILQKTIIQAKEMAQLNPNSLNTVRVITVYNGGEPYVFGTFFRMGTEKTREVDNWAVGGLLTGVLDGGYLTEYAMYKPGYGTKVKYHPESKVEFGKFCIPHYEEMLQLSCEAHKIFANVHSIGWDVALTNEGPLFIEGNDNWEISPVQAVMGPLKKEWNFAKTAK